MRRHLVGGVLCLALASGGTRVADAQRPLAVRAVKVGDTGYQMCHGNVPAFTVSLDGGLVPKLEISVYLKPAPDSLTGAMLRFDLVHADGEPVEMADSTTAR